MSTPEVAIIGAGIHPFRRYADPSALEMGAVAIGHALKEAGVLWSDMGSLYAGSLEVSNPEAVTGRAVMTGVPARATLNGCATGNTLLTLAARDVQLGEAEVAVGAGLGSNSASLVRAACSYRGERSRRAIVHLLPLDRATATGRPSRMADRRLSDGTISNMAADCHQDGPQHSEPTQWRIRWLNCAVSADFGNDLFGHPLHVVEVGA